jgi:hypothetical protein
MSAAPGRPQGSHGIDRKQADYDAFADQCAGKGMPITTFYPQHVGQADDARRICRRCPVKAECLAYALKYNERDGVWGGTSVRERRALKKQQKAFAARVNA